MHALNWKRQAAQQRWQADTGLLMSVNEYAGLLIVLQGLKQQADELQAPATIHCIHSALCSLYALYRRG
jgi:hypothetical protein